MKPIPLPTPELPPGMPPMPDPDPGFHREIPEEFKTPPWMQDPIMVDPETGGRYVTDPETGERIPSDDPRARPPRPRLPDPAPRKPRRGPYSPKLEELANKVLARLTQE